MTIQLLTVAIDPVKAAVVVAMAWLGWRLVLVALFPYAPCSRCQGNPRSFHGSNWRLCRKCGGQGSQLRWERRVWRWLTSGD